MFNYNIHSPTVISEVSLFAGT